MCLTMADAVEGGPSQKPHLDLIGPKVNFTQPFKRCSPPSDFQNHFSVNDVYRQEINRRVSGMQPWLLQDL